MAFYGKIPEAPDIRQQRPGYFNKAQQPDFGNQFAMPQGVKPYDVNDSGIPDLWPEIQQELRGIMQKGREPFYMTPEGGQLTPEQQEHNKMLMAWKSPAGLSAIETGKYREMQASQAGIDRAEKRVANIEKQLLQAFKAEAPKGLIMQIEKRYNGSVKALDTLLTKGGDKEGSGFPLFTGEGKMKLEGMEDEKGMFSKIGDWFRGQQAPDIPGMPDEGFQTPEQVAADPAEQAPQKSNLVIQGLLAMDALMAKHLGNDKAKQLTDQIVAGSKDPSERLEQAIQALPPKAQKDPEVQALARQLTAQKMQMPGWQSDMTPERKMQQAGGPPPGQTAESMPVLRRFQRGIPQPGGG